MSQGELFQRRYLSLIWIVQELLLAKKAVLPLGDLDILCDGKETMQLILRGSQGQLERSAAAGQYISQLLDATSHCHASDPRDRIYGLLGLFNPKHISRELVANYSLSWRDCWLGTAAYMLLIEGNLILFAHSAGCNGPMNLPSWVPDIEDTRFWFVEFKSKAHEETLRNAWLNDMALSAAEKWATEIVMYSVESKERQVQDSGSRRGQKSHWSVHSRALHTTNLKSASVDSSDGSLQLQALRVFDGPRRLTTESEENGLTSIWVRGPSTATQFRTTGLKHPEALCESHWFYIIDDEDLDAYSDADGERSVDFNTGLLALATVPPENDSSVVTLHDCCIVFDVRIYSMTLIETKPERFTHITNTLPSLHWVPEALRSVPIRGYVEESTDEWIFTCMFPSGKATTRDIFPLLVSLAEQEGLLHVLPVSCPCWPTQYLRLWRASVQSLTQSFRTSIST